jgi:hypothetical protein
MEVVLQFGPPLFLVLQDPPCTCVICGAKGSLACLLHDVAAIVQHLAACLADAVQPRQIVHHSGWLPGDLPWPGMAVMQSCTVFKTAYFVLFNQ